MKRQEFDSLMMILLEKSINLEFKSNLMFSSTIFLTNKADELFKMVDTPGIPYDDKSLLEKQLNHIIKKMEWELIENKKLELEAKSMDSEMDRLSKLKNTEGLEDDNLN